MRWQEIDIQQMERSDPVILMQFQIAYGLLVQKNQKIEVSGKLPGVGAALHVVLLLHQRINKLSGHGNLSQMRAAGAEQLLQKTIVA